MPASRHTPTVPPVSAAHRRALVGLGIGLALADSSVVTLALPDILRQFDVEIPQVAWVLTAYNLGLALAAVPAAYVARRRPRTAFAAGTLVFAAASLACGLAPSFGVLVGARCVQAVGGALLSLGDDLSLRVWPVPPAPRATLAVAGANGLAWPDELVVATPPPDHANWLEQDLLERVRAEHRLPVSHLVVEPRDNGR